MAGHNSLELEIHTLFREGNDLDAICVEILSKYERSDVVSPSEAESLSHFLLLSGRLDLLFPFYLHGLRKESLPTFPWGYLGEAVRRLEPEIPQLLVNIIEMGLDSQPNEETSYKSEALLESIPNLLAQLQSQKKSFESEKLKLKAKLIAQLNHNRLYQQRDQEEQTLLQLIKIFPNDLDVKLMQQAHLEKKADEILARAKSPRGGSSSSPLRRSLLASDPETQEFSEKLSSTLIAMAERMKIDDPNNIYNLAILAMQSELFDLSLKILEMAEQQMAAQWLRAEILFESGRCLELLKHLENIERNMNFSAETTYGTVYLKAQAYYGLGQKEIAIRLLESLSDKAPHYRSTQALLHEWKTS